MSIPIAPTRPATVRSPRPWRTALLGALTVWAVTTVARVAASAFGTVLHPYRINGWDAQHYVTIAERGYHEGPGYPAFFPLYPLLIRLIDPVIPGGSPMAALVIANAAGIGALAVLHRLAVHEFGAAVAQRATWYLAVTPMGFFLFIGYNESLFILLALSSLYAGRRGHWWLAGTLAGLSSATRLFGVLLLIPLAFEYLRRSRFRSDVLALALVPSGALAYSLYCWIALGDPLAFSAAQDEWGRRYTFPGEAWLIAIGQADTSPAAAILDSGAVLIAAVLLILCVWGPYRFRRDQAYLVIQGALTLAMLMSTEVGGRAMQSAPRYTMEAVALFLVLARIGADPLADRAVLTIGVAAQAAFLLLFMTGTFLVA